MCSNLCSDVVDSTTLACVSWDRSVSAGSHGDLGQSNLEAVLAVAQRDLQNAAGELLSL